MKKSQQQLRWSATNATRNVVSVLT